MLKIKTTTKTTAPGIPEGIVPRERLFRLLDKSLKKPVVWISGPGGSGKTTLVTSYLETHKIPYLWYQVDQRDTDSATFFYYMGLALQQHFAGKKDPLPLLKPEYLAGIKTFTRRYFEQLFQSLPDPFTIVLDNYQDVSPYAPFHEVIFEGLSLIPQGINLIALSRDEPPPLFAAQDDAERYSLIGWNDIRFSFQEATEFSHLQTVDRLSTVTLLRLYAKTDGWIAGLQLILGSLQDSLIDEEAFDKLSFDEVFDYFTEAIFSRTDRETQTFLLKTAFAPGLTALMARRLTGVRSAERILSRLSRNHFFTVKRSRVDPVYEYHPLFRAFLLARAAQSFSAEEVSTIRKKAASLLEASGRMEAAYGLFIEAADWEEVKALILKSAPTLIAEGRSEVVRAWLVSLPSEVLAGNPDLLYWLGVCLMTVNPQESRHSFQKAFDLYALKNDKLGMLLSWSGGADITIIEMEFTHLDQWLALLEGMQVEDFAFPTPEIEARLVMSIFNSMAFRHTTHPDIEKWSNRAAGLLHSNVDINLRLLAGIFLAAHYLWMGNFGKAGFFIRQLQSMVSSKGVSPLAANGVKLAELLHALLTAAGENGVALATEALKISHETGVHVWDAQLLCHGFCCAISSGDHVAADRLLAELRSTIEGKNRFEVGYYHALIVWQELLHGNFTSAHSHFQITQENFQASGFRPVEVCVLHGLVEIMRAKGDLEQVRKYVARSYEVTRETKSRYCEFISLFDDMLLAIDAKENARLLILLRKAMALAKENGFANMWLWRPESMILICEKALENNIEVDYVQQIIRKLKLVPQTPPLHLESWPWELKIYTLGAFTIMRDDNSLLPMGKTKKPIDLLKALIALGGSQVPAERLASDLWSDADGDFAHHAFETTLHRLRKLLGNGQVLKFEAGKLSLDPRFCWIDTQAFYNISEELDTLFKGPVLRDEKCMEPLFEKVISLYKGHFLPNDVEQSWTIWRREHLRSRFMHIITKAGGFWEGQKQWEKASELYQRGLQVDRLAEDFYQRVMVCYHSQGKTVEAARTYQTCRSILAISLDLRPSPKTEQIYQDIKNTNFLPNPR